MRRRTLLGAVAGLPVALAGCTDAVPWGDDAPPEADRTGDCRATVEVVSASATHEELEVAASADPLAWQYTDRGRGLVFDADAYDLDAARDDYEAAEDTDGSVGRGQRCLVSWSEVGSTVQFIADPDEETVRETFEDLVELERYEAQPQGWWVVHSPHRSHEELSSRLESLDVDGPYEIVVYSADS